MPRCSCRTAEPGPWHVAVSDTLSERSCRASPSRAESGRLRRAALPSVACLAAVTLPRRPAPRITLTDITREAGITARHDNGAAGGKLLPETMGAGAAFLDYDNDGHQDLLS